jgi:hypothetical protein
MKKLIAVSSSAALALVMLLPVARQVNASTVNHSVFGQGGQLPGPTGGSGGHFQGGQLPGPTGGSGGH